MSFIYLTMAKQRYRYRLHQQIPSCPSPDLVQLASWPGEAWRGLGAGHGEVLGWPTMGGQHVTLFPPADSSVLTASPCPARLAPLARSAPRLRLLPLHHTVFSPLITPAQAQTPYYTGTHRMADMLPLTACPSPCSPSA